uniref:Ribonuclease HII n=1 Tax=Desulfatirhabdium butyrativorans TaxID=340467 RepID=A0A7C4W1J4_9BACT
MQPHGFGYPEQALRERGFSIIAGIDEAGRGPLAGPVVAAAVVLPTEARLEGVADSKKLTPASRNRLYDEIYRVAVTIGIGIVDASEIDRTDILKASLLAMRFALENLDPHPECLIIDGNHCLPMPAAHACPRPFQQAIPKGDSLCMSISAASIVAKVTRDRLMALYHEHHPEYGFSRHKGYPTEHHRQAIRTFGPCWIHRKTFQGVREAFLCKPNPAKSASREKAWQQITFESMDTAFSS